MDALIDAKKNDDEQAAAAKKKKALLIIINGDSWQEQNGTQWNA